MAQLREFTYPSSDGVHTIHAQEWVPQVPLRGVVQIVHGVAEHMGRYEGAAAFLAEAIWCAARTTWVTARLPVRARRAFSGRRTAGPW